MSPNFLFYQGHEFNRSLYKAFTICLIENMWLPFFCNTANITTSRIGTRDLVMRGGLFVSKTLLYSRTFSSMAFDVTRGSLFLLSVTMETCLWTENCRGSSLCDRVLE